MSDKIKKQYNTVLERVEVRQVDGQFVVIDSHGREHGRWRDHHHAIEHASLINSLIDGAENAIKDRKKPKSGFKQYKQATWGGISPKTGNSNSPQ